MNLPTFPRMTTAEALLMSHARRAAYAVQLRNAILDERPEWKEHLRKEARAWARLARESWAAYLKIKERR